MVEAGSGDERGESRRVRSCGDCNAPPVSGSCGERLCKAPFAVFRFLEAVVKAGEPAGSRGSSRASRRAACAWRTPDCSPANCGLQSGRSQQAVNGYVETAMSGARGCSAGEDYLDASSNREHLALAPVGRRQSNRPRPIPANRNQPPCLATRRPLCSRKTWARCSNSLVHGSSNHSRALGPA